MKINFLQHGQFISNFTFASLEHKTHHHKMINDKCIYSNASIKPNQNLFHKTISSHTIQICFNLLNTCIYKQRYNWPNVYLALQRDSISTYSFAICLYFPIMGCHILNTIFQLQIYIHLMHILKK